MAGWTRPGRRSAGLVAAGFATALSIGHGIVRGQDEARGSNSGAKLFEAYCTACHQYDNQGMGEAPPLDDSPWVNGPPVRLIRIVLHGVEGRIEVKGRTYDREMPGFGRVLSDQQVAALASYTRARFGTPSPRVTAEEVERVRRESAGRTDYWPADQLLELR